MLSCNDAPSIVCVCVCRDSYFEICNFLLLWAQEDFSSLCYNHFNKLPKRGKPEEGRGWTLLVAKSTQHDDMKTAKCPFNHLLTVHKQVLSLGTGTKCIGQSAMSTKGKCQKHFAQINSQNTLCGSK
uniref:Uncharacterized protein n=1 Tax=Cyprinus carpio TaxID=7962 RepID=A0A8C2CIY8_CYPCA